MRTLTLLPLAPTYSPNSISGALTNARILKGPPYEWPRESFLTRQGERSLFVKDDAIGNFVSAAMIVGTFALFAALAYAAAIILANAYVLTQSDGMLVV